MTKIEFKNLPDTSTPISAENLNTLQDNVENAIPEIDNAVSTSSTNGVENQAITNYVDASVSGDLIVNSIRTKNLFDKRTIVAGDIMGAFNDIRLSSRQPLWLEAGTYTFSCDITSPLRYSINVENAGLPPLSSYPTMILDSGWQSASSLTYTFTITTAGWCVINVSKENNATLTVSEISSFSFQLEEGSEAHTITPYQSLDYEEPIIDITKQITWKSGFELKDGKLWKQGKRIFGTLNISGTMSTGSQVIDIFTIPYSFPANFVFGCTATTRDQWGYPDGMAYCYMSQYGHFNANANINAKFLRVQFEFVTV